jgi:hypothetical protein
MPKDHNLVVRDLRDSVEETAFGMVSPRDGAWPGDEKWWERPHLNTHPTETSQILGTMNLGGGGSVTDYSQQGQQEPQDEEMTGQEVADSDGAVEDSGWWLEYPEENNSDGTC